MSTYEHGRFTELTDLLCQLFPVGSDQLLAIWREGDQTAQSPLDKQFSHAPSGSRLIAILLAMPQTSGTLPGLAAELPDTPAQQYAIPFYFMERWAAARGAVFPLLRREALLNYGRSKIDPWCTTVQAGTVTQPTWGILHDARITATDIDATSPLTKHGWLTAALTVTVTLTQRRT
jgi:hypothetical protein